MSNNIKLYENYHMIDDIRNQLLDLQTKEDLNLDVDKLIDILIDMIDIFKENCLIINKNKSTI
jgi:hypothetical protein